MEEATILSLIENIIILLIYSVIYDFYWIKYRETGKRIMKYATGILVGCICITLMHKHIVWYNETYIDTRTVLLCLTGLFFGTTPTLTAAAIAATYRIFLGGDGIYAGLAAIITSTAISLIIKKLKPNWITDNYLKTLATAGITTHFIMYAETLLLPEDLMIQNFKYGWSIMLIVFPIGTILLGKLMVHQSSQWNLKEELLQSEERFRKVALCADDFFWELNKDGKCTYVSDNVTKILGYLPDEFIGLSPFDIINDPESSEMIRQFAYGLPGKNQKKNDTFDGEIKLIHKDKSEIRIRARGMKTTTRLGELIGYIGVAQNVTEQYIQRDLMRRNQLQLREQNRRYENLNKELITKNEKIQTINQQLLQAKDQAIAAGKAKTDFIAAISHEIHRPITNINEFVQLILEPSISEDERRKFLNIIKQRCNSVMTMLNDILDMNKIETGQLVITETIGNITDTFNNLYELFNSQNLYLDKKPIYIIKKIEIDENERTIKTDFARLKQILANLIFNAYRSTTAGTISFSCRPYSNNKEIIFEVKDSGTGMPEILKEDFNKNNLTQRGALGLAISKKLVEMLGGKIWFESSPTTGTIFYFTIPYKKISKLGDSTINYNWQEKRALLIEYDRFEAIYICENLVKTGIKYHVTLCNNNKPITIAQDFNFHLVIIATSPKIDETIEILNNIKNTHTNPTIIAIANNNTDQEKDILIQNGCHAYIEKPINGAKMLQTIAEKSNF